ncbi:MAG TPA: flagellin [Bryobacteraceae bacterium]|jgi:flagellar hook-associated protein 3 FlgL
MITNLDPASQLFLSDLERAQQRVSEAQRQISSGKRVNVASDDPDIVSDLLRLRSAMERNTQIQSNLATAQAAASVADNTLSASIQLLDCALTLAAQGVTATQTAAGRQSIAGDIQSLQEQLVSFSQTQSGGRYIFSGDQDTAPAYQLNLANPNGVDRLLTSPSTRLIENPAGGSFLASQTAQDVFDTRNPDDSLAPDNAFAALNSLRVALLNNDLAGINSAIGSIKLASDRLNASQSFYAAVENRLQNATDFTNQYAVQLKTELSQREDADIVAASLELSQGNLQVQSALQMRGSVPRTTLFDFLNR